MGKIRDALDRRQAIRDGVWQPISYAKKAGGKKKKKDEPNCKNSQECNVGGKKYCIPKGKTCGGKVRARLDPRRVDDLRKMGGTFEGAIGGLKNGKKYQITPEMLQIANQLGVSQLQLQAGRVPKAAQADLIKSFDQTTIGDSPTKPKPEPKPKPKPEPKPKQPTVDDIQENDFTRKWRGSWTEADVPQDLLRVLSKIPPPKESSDPQNIGKGASFNASRQEIKMGSGLKPKTQDAQACYRHEFGHYIDNQAAKLPRIQAERSDLVEKDYQERAKKLLKEPKFQWILPQEQRQAIWDEYERAAQKAVKEWDRSKYSDEQLSILKQSLDLEVFRSDGQRLIPIPGVTDKLIEIGLGSRTADMDKDFFLAPTEEILATRRITRQEASAQYASDSTSYLEAQKADEKALKAAQNSRMERYIETAHLQGKTEKEIERVAREAAEKAAKSHPGLAVIKAIIDESKHVPSVTQAYKKAFNPDGTPRSPEDLLRVMRESLWNIDENPRVARLENLEDLIGSTTKNIVGHGHSNLYYESRTAGTLTGRGGQLAEAFANMTDLHANSASTRALLEYFVPNQYREYKRILKELGEMES